MYFRQPRYFTDFRCVGGTCTNSCCIGWKIFWTQDEIDKVKNDPNCSEELRALMENSFHPSSDGEKNKYSMTLEEKTNRCPFLTEDNFCKIQRELGAAGYENKGTDDLLTKAAAFITRSLSHNHKNTDSLLETMKKAKVFSPAYLALFVK